MVTRGAIRGIVRCAGDADLLCGRDAVAPGALRAGPVVAEAAPAAAPTPAIIAVTAVAALGPAVAAVVTPSTAPIRRACRWPGRRASGRSAGGRCRRGGELAGVPGLAGFAATTTAPTAAAATAAARFVATGPAPRIAAGIAAGAWGVARIATRRGVVVIALIALLIIAVITRPDDLGLGTPLPTLGAHTPAAAPSAATLPAAPTARAVAARTAGQHRVLGGDANDGVLRAEAEEAGLTLSDDVDVDLLATQAQLVQCPPDCLVDRFAAGFCYPHQSSSIRSGPRRGPPRAG